MPFANDLALDKVALELTRHRLRAIAAVADEANAPTRKPLDGRNANLFSKAFGQDFAFIQADEKDPAHFFSARRAAAIASFALE